MRSSWSSSRLATSGLWKSTRPVLRLGLRATIVARAVMTVALAPKAAIVARAVMTVAPAPKAAIAARAVMTVAPAPRVAIVARAVMTVVPALSSSPLWRQQQRWLHR